jgi:hypothetical protein
MPRPRERISVMRNPGEPLQRTRLQNTGLPHTGPLLIRRRLRILLLVAIRHQPLIQRPPLMQLPPATPRPRMLPRLNRPTLDMHPAARRRRPHMLPRMEKAAVTKNNNSNQAISGSRNFFGCPAAPVTASAARYPLRTAPSMVAGQPLRVQSPARNRLGILLALGGRN